MLHDYLPLYADKIFSITRRNKSYQALSNFQHQLVFLELKLLDIDGFTLLQQLKQRHEWQSIPVIVISALAFQTDWQRAFNLGAKHYFIKPVELPALLQKIREKF